MASWLDLEGKNIAAFLITGILGFVVAAELPVGPWIAYAPILLAYHFFLAWLVSTHRGQAGISMSLVPAVLTHSAFVAIVVAVGADHGGTIVLRFLRFGIVTVGLFERYWLLDVSEKVQLRVKLLEAKQVTVLSSPDDYSEWMTHLAKTYKRSHPFDGSLRNEYQTWLSRKS